MKNSILFTLSLLSCVFATEQLHANPLVRLATCRAGRKLLFCMGAAAGSFSATAGITYAKKTVRDSTEAMGNLTQEVNRLARQSFNSNKACANKPDSALVLYLNSLYIDECADKALEKERALTKKVSRWMRILPGHYEDGFVRNQTVFTKTLQPLWIQQKKSCDILDAMPCTGKDLRVIKGYLDSKQPKNTTLRPFQGIDVQVLRNGVSDLWKRAKTEFAAIVDAAHSAGPMLFMAGR